MKVPICVGKKISAIASNKILGIEVPVTLEVVDETASTYTLQVPGNVDKAMQFKIKKSHSFRNSGGNVELLIFKEVMLTANIG